MPTVLRRLLDTAPVVALRRRTVRTLGVIAAFAVALHALARVLLTDHRGTGEWTYLGLSLAIALLVVLLTRGSSSARTPGRRD